MKSRVRNVISLLRQLDIHMDTLSRSEEQELGAVLTAIHEHLFASRRTDARIIGFEPDEITIQFAGLALRFRDEYNLPESERSTS